MNRPDWNVAYAECMVRLLGCDAGFARLAAEADDAGYESEPDDPLTAVHEELSNWTDDEGASPD